MKSVFAKALNLRVCGTAQVPTGAAAAAAAAKKGKMRWVLGVFMTLFLSLSLPFSLSPRQASLGTTIYEHVKAKQSKQITLA